jgi:hypothetical protein
VGHGVDTELAGVPPAVNETPVSSLRGDRDG